MILILITVDEIIQGCDHVDYFIEFHGDCTYLFNLSQIIVQNEIGASKVKNMRTRTAEGYLKIAERIRDDIENSRKDRKEATMLVSKIEELLENRNRGK